MEALARDETSSGFAEVSCYYEEVTDSNGDVVQSHAIMCEKIDFLYWCFFFGGFLWN